jgi:hypothetical protein
VYSAFTKSGKYDESGRELTVWELLKKVQLNVPIPVFGQLVYARIPNAEQLPKLTNRARACAFLGIKEDHYHSYILFALDTGHVVYSNDVQVVYNTYAYQLRPIVAGLPKMHMGEPTHLSSLPRSDDFTAESIMPEKRQRFDFSTDPMNDEYFADASDHQEYFRTNYLKADFTPRDTLFNFVHVMFYVGNSDHKAENVIASHHTVSKLDSIVMQRLPNRANLVLNMRLATSIYPTKPYYQRIYTIAEQKIAYHLASPTEKELDLEQLFYAAKV